MTSKEDLDFALADMYNEGSDDEREAALQEAMAGEAALQEALDFALAEMYENEYQSNVDGEFLSDLSLAELESGVGLTPLQAKKVLSRFKEAPN